jgi:hypothetical protein
MQIPDCAMSRTVEPTGINVDPPPETGNVCEPLKVATLTMTV